MVPIAESGAGDGEKDDHARGFVRGGLSEVGLTRTESATLVELVLKEITDCLERGETVKLSSFGSFVVRKKGQRIGRNPRPARKYRSRRAGSWCSSPPLSSSSGSIPDRMLARHLNDRFQKKKIKYLDRVVIMATSNCEPVGIIWEYDRGELIVDGIVHVLNESRVGWRDRDGHLNG